MHAEALSVVQDTAGAILVLGELRPKLVLDLVADVLEEARGLPSRRAIALNAMGHRRHGSAVAVYESSRLEAPLRGERTIERGALVHDAPSSSSEKIWDASDASTPNFLGSSVMKRASPSA